MNNPEHKAKDISELTHEEQLQLLAHELEKLHRRRGVSEGSAVASAQAALAKLFPSRLGQSELQSLLKEFDEMIVAAEQMHRAEVKKNRREGIEALADFFVAFKNIFLPDTESFRKMFPRIQSIEHDILGYRFDDANCTIIAVIAYFRKLREDLANDGISGGMHDGD